MKKRIRTTSAYAADARCQVEGCTRTPRARSLCGAHYQRWRSFGNPLQVTGFRGRSTSARFWAKVDGGNVEDCWLWLAAKKNNGYGVFQVGQQQVLAHRFAYEDLLSPIPDGLQIDHLCRTRDCVNPWHLDPVTAEVNSQRRSAVAA